MQHANSHPAPLISDNALATRDAIAIETVAIAEAQPEKRQLLSDITSILGTLEGSIAGLNEEVSTLLEDVENLDVEGILEDIKADLAGDVQLVEDILADVGIGLDLSGVLGTVNGVIDIVNELNTQVDALIADTTVGDLVAEIEGLISQLLTGLGQIA